MLWSPCQHHRAPWWPSLTPQGLQLQPPGQPMPGARSLCPRLPQPRRGGRSGMLSSAAGRLRSSSFALAAFGDGGPAQAGTGGLCARTAPQLPGVHLLLGPELPLPPRSPRAPSRSCSADAPTQGRGQILFSVLLSVLLCGARLTYGHQDLASVGPRGA